MSSQKGEPTTGRRGSSRGPRAGEIHPVVVRQRPSPDEGFGEERTMERRSPLTSVGQRLNEREVRDIERKEAQLAKYELDDAIEEKLTRIREHRARRDALDAKERQTADEQQQQGMMPAGNAEAISPEIVKYILSLPEAKQEKAMQMVIQMKLRGDPSMASQMVMLDAINKASTPSVQAADPVKTVESWLELVDRIESKRQPQQEYAQQLQPPAPPQKSWFEEMAEKFFRNKFEEFLNGGTPTTPSAAATEKVQTYGKMIYDKETGTYIPSEVKTWDEALKVDDLLTKKKSIVADQKLKEKRWTDVKDMLLKPNAKRIPAILDKLEENAGNLMKGRTAPRVPLTQVAPAPPPPPQVQIEGGTTWKCIQCGTDIKIPSPAPPSIICPNCKMVYEESKEDEPQKK